MLINKKSASLCLIFVLFIGIWINNAYSIHQDPGETIQISTRLRSFVGNPSWLIVIRDLDHGQNIPYLYDIKKGENYWMAFTAGKNYLILASTLRINTHGTRQNRYKQYVIHDFCHLESKGRIARHQSLYITVTGDLTSNPNTVDCNVARFTHSEF